MSYQKVSGQILAIILRKKSDKSLYKKLALMFKNITQPVKLYT